MLHTNEPAFLNSLPHPASLITNGKPQCMASTLDIPKLSHLDRRQKIEAFLYSLTISLSLKSVNIITALFSFSSSIFLLTVLSILYLQQPLQFSISNQGIFAPLFGILILRYHDPFGGLCDLHLKLFYHY